MYCSESPSMYCHRSLGSNVRVSLAFSQPATAPDAGNGLAPFFLHPLSEPLATVARTTTMTNKMLGFLIRSSTPSQQDLAARRAALSDAGDVDCGLVLKRTGILACPAANASARIHTRLFQY